MHSITDWLSSSSGAAVYAIVFALVFCEDALFFGFVLPGETAVVLGGVIAGQGKISVYWLAAIVVLAAVAGDSVGYEIGRRYGSRILQTKALRGHHERIERAEALIRRRGPAAVFLGRFIAFFRALMPALAGISRMPYRVFLLFNALGGLVWGVGFVLLGYFAGDAYDRVERTAGTAVAAVVAAVVVVALVVWHIRRKRRGPGGEGPSSTGRAGGEGDGPPGPDGGGDGRRDGGSTEAGHSGWSGTGGGGATGAGPRPDGGHDGGDDGAGDDTARH